MGYWFRILKIDSFDKNNAVYKINCIIFIHFNDNDITIADFEKYNDSNRKRFKSNAGWVDVKIKTKFT